MKKKSASDLEFEHPVITALAFLIIGSVYSSTKTTIRTTSFLTRFLGTKSNVFSKVFFERFAYYQFLVLIHVVNILKINDEELNIFGWELNKEFLLAVEEHKEFKKIKSNIKKALSDKQFHNLISSYLSGDRTISGLSEEHFSFLLGSLKFKRTEDFITISYAVSFSRILRALEIVKNNFPLPLDYGKRLELWGAHSIGVKHFIKWISNALKNEEASKALKEEIKRAK